MHVYEIRPRKDHRGVDLTAIRSAVVRWTKCNRLRAVSQRLAEHGAKPLGRIGPKIRSALQHQRQQHEPPPQGESSARQCDGLSRNTDSH